MKHLYHCLLYSFILLPALLHSQVPYLNSLPNGPSKKAFVAEQVGLTDISVQYHRPSVSGREGKIWGQVVHEGFVNQGFGNNKPAPWRAGANENTIFECSRDILVEGKALPRGTYGFFVAYQPGACTIIFSKKHDAWGSFFYEEADDVLRVTVTPKPLNEPVEWLRYTFNNQTENKATLTLEWEKLAIPVTIETNYVKDQFEAMASKLKKPAGFTWQALTQAAAWCLSRNYELPQALAWAKLSSDPNSFGGDKFFTAISTTAQILTALGRNSEADAEMKRALPLATMLEMHQYARQLLTAKKATEAAAVFATNYKKYPDQFTTLVGMARGLSATGEYKKALAFAEKALPLAPNAPNKTALEKMVEQLKSGKDIN